MDSSNSSFTTNNNNFNPNSVRHSSFEEQHSRLHLGMSLFGTNVNMNMYGNSNNLSHNEKDRDALDEISDEHSCFSNEIDRQSYNENNHNSFENNEEDRENEDINGEEGIVKFKRIEQTEREELEHKEKENEIKFSLFDKTRHKENSEKRTSSLSDTEVIDSEKRIKLKHFSETNSNSNF